MKNGVKFYNKDDIILSKNGHVVCTVTRDIYSGDDVTLDQFENWLIPAPKTVEQLISTIDRYFATRRVANDDADYMVT